METRKDNNDMMQSLKSTCKKSLWMMLLLLAGWTDGAWAADYPYTYLIVNRKGEVAMWYREVQTAGEAPHIPENIRTPLLATTAFHYYAWDASYWDRSQGVLYHRWTDQLSWQEQYSGIIAEYKTYNCHPYGKYTIPSGATELAELPVPTDASWGATILVTYDANATIQPVDGITVDINGGTAYNISAYNQDINDNTNKRGYYYSAGTSLSWNSKYTENAIADAKSTNAYLWYFEGGDPYDLHLRNANAPAGTTLAAKYNRDHDPQVSSLSFQDAASVGRTSSSDYLYHSVALFSNSSGKGPFEIMFTYQGGTARPGRSIAHAYPYLTSNDAGSEQMIRAAWATPDGMSTGATRWGHNHTDVAITLEPHYNKTCTYKVINKQGRIAIAEESSGNLLSLPDDIKSPYITNIKYYKSTAFADAANGDFTFTATGAGENITSLNDFADGETIYATYDYDATAAATDGINITGSFNYGIQVGGKHLYLDNATVGTADTGSDQTAYLWKMKSTSTAQPDPYDVKLYNRSDETTPQFSPTAFILVNSGGDLNLMVASGTTTIAYLGYDTANGLTTANDGTTPSEVAAVLTAKNHNHRYWIVADEDGTTRVAAAYPSDDECNQLTVPAVINSPLVSEYTFYTNPTDAMNRTNAITELPTGDYTSDIYVRYTYNRNNGILDIENGKEYNLIINSEKKIWMTYQQGYGSNNDIGIGKPENYEDDNHLWKFSGGDPYGIYISNKATPNHVTGNQNSGAGVNENNGTYNYTAALFLSYSDKYYPHRFFLVKSPLWTAENPLYLMRVSMNDANTYEKIYTWGWEQTDGSRWDKSYCRMWRVKDDTDPALQLEIRPHVMDSITYHVIDKQNKEVISAAIESKDLELPADISSPLVAEYHYWTLDNFTTTTRNDSTIYTLKPEQTELTALGSNTDIYVTYDVDPGNGILTVIDTQDETATRIATLAKRDKDKFLAAGNGTMRIFNLKFLNGNSFRQENGKDGFEDDATQAIYPYTNGDANMYVYGAKDWTAQLSQGASTRTRWPWFITSKDNDPYHVIITSYKETHNEKQDPLKDAGGENTTGQKNYYSFFRTYYEPNYYGEGSGHIITTNVTDDPRVTTHVADANNEFHENAEAVPTEYMLLGTTGHYKLLTVSPVDDGDASTPDERQYVHSFEQYWKTWDTVRRWNDAKKDFDDYEAGRVTSALTSYHAYKAWANALPDVTEKGSKRFAYETHYFQTIEMGQEFDLEEVSFTPVMVLVDNHGWEIMRYPIVPKGDPDRADMELRLNFYNSPAVEKYLWYTTGKKADGYQKYSLADPEITIYKKDDKGKWVEDADREKYVHTSTTLSDIPYDHLNTAQGYAYDYPTDNMKDLYVTYVVKDEYKNTYNSEDNTSAPFLFKQGSNYASTDGTTVSPVATSTVTTSTDGKYLSLTGSSIGSNLLWYLKRNTDIDHEMGYLYEGEANAETDAKSKEETEDGYNNRTDALQHNGFDPYNVQIQAVTGGKYLTTSATDAELYHDGTVQADNDYTTAGLSNHVEDDADQAFTFLNHGNKPAHVTNQTYMLIKDASGKNRLFPRFDHRRAVENFTTMGAWNSTDAGKETEFIPVGHYTIVVCDSNVTGNPDPVPVVSREVWAKAGQPIGESPTESIPLPADMIRGGCYYPGAFTAYAQSGNTYSGKTVLYPIDSDISAEGGTKIYVPFKTDGTDGSIWFASTEEDAVENGKWNFLMQGLESRAVLFGTDYMTGDDHNQYEDEVLPGERTIVRWGGTNNSSEGIAGFNFIGRTSALETADGDGKQAMPETDDKVGVDNKYRWMQASGNQKGVHLMSPLNDFARIAETYINGKDADFREGRWLWAFIGNPYDGFYIINKEVKDKGKDKRLALVSSDGRLKAHDYIRLTKDYNDKTGDDYDHPWLWKAVQLDTSSDAEAAGSFGLQLADVADKVVSRNDREDEEIDLEAYSASKNNSDFFRKRSSFIAYPWKGLSGAAWNGGNKYKRVRVNVYQDAVASENLITTRLYTEADRAFIAGDVVDGTDGHYYLPIEGQADGSWKPVGVVNREMPYDNHLINIPYDLRRQFCSYSVEGGSFTVQDTDDEQTLNLIFTIDTEHAPLFLSEDELATFRAKKDDDTFKDGKTKKDYYYFIDTRWKLDNHLYVNDKDANAEYPTTFNSRRFNADNVDRLMYFFVGNPYKLRVFNVYTDKKDAAAGLGARNLVRNKFPGEAFGSYGENSTFDNYTYMDNTKDFYWEMVETSPYSQTYSPSSNPEVYYRKDYVKDRWFSLRTKDMLDTDANISLTTYYYLGHNGKTGGTPVYYAANQTVNPRKNAVDGFSFFPDAHHAIQINANGEVASYQYMLLALPPAKVHLTVYDPDEPSRKVTDNELSEYYALTDRFSGVPDNLQRNYCEYWWASTDSDIRSANMLDGNGYFEIGSTDAEKDIHIYAQYRETDDSPFSLLNSNGIPELKKSGTYTSPWFNMSINGRWAYFNSGLTGLTAAINGDQTTAGKANNSVLSFPYNGDIKNVEDRFHKGMHWALVGGPYNFTLRCQRDIIALDGSGKPAADSNGEYQYSNAYINETAINSDATTWTWLRKASVNGNTMADNHYFLSESQTRRTQLKESVSEAKAGMTNSPRRILPNGYTIDAADSTLNVKVNGTSAVISKGYNYDFGDRMLLVNVDAEEANNEAFDAVVIVYNKMNEPVATTGWTELVRKNENGNGRIPYDVQRWGCTYHYWADETMTKYPFTNFNQKDDSGNYLIQDGGIVYVTYDYDESLYSSENEYHWMNIFFNWDDIYKKNELVANSEALYTAEYWEYQAPQSGEGTGQFVKRYDHAVTNPDAKTYKFNEQYRETKEGWISSPADDNDGITKDKAWAYETAQTEDSEQKWALIGDPYKFILYNYNRKAEAGGTNSYYLYRHPLTGSVENKNFNSYTPYTRATYPGLYWTWKVDGTRYTYAEKTGETGSETTSYVKKSGLPESFFKNASGSTADDLSIETGYLALCDMRTTSLYDKNNLLGAVVGYASFDHKRYTGDQVDLTVSYTYQKGSADKYKTYVDDPKTTVDDVYIDETRQTVDYTDFSHIANSANRDEILALWRSNYASNGGSADSNGDGIYDNGTYQGCYVGDSPEPVTDVKAYGQKQVWSEEKADNKKNLVMTGRASVNGAMNTGDAERFLIVPMQAQAASVTFHLDTESGKYADGTDIDTRRDFNTAPIPDHTTTNFGVGNTVVLPWLMRRQYCDYDLYVVKDGSGNLPDATEYSIAAPENNHYIDGLAYAAGKPSNKMQLESRGDEYKAFWANHATEKMSGVTMSNGEIEISIPESWQNKHVYICVKYKPTNEFKALQSTSTDGQMTGGKSVRWVNITNQEKGNMMQYTRTNKVTGEHTDSINDVTNDYLWAIEGDPYGFVLHNRYANHGFNGTANEFWTNKILRTEEVNATLNYNTEPGDNYFTYGAASDATKTIEDMGSASHSVYEAMTGNYSGAMMIHPVDACINVKNQNGYKYSGAFVFNGAPTGYPIQLNYLEEWAAMRNVFCNWHIQRPTKEQILPYYNRAGFVGGLLPTIAANTELPYGGGTVNVPALFGKLAAGTATSAEFNTAWALVHDPASLVPFTDGGYYRLKAYSAGNGAVGGDYVSGYRHKRELASGTPLHINSNMTAASSYKDLTDFNGNSWTDGITNSSLLEIMNTEFDPSSVFRFTRDEDGYIKMVTQGLIVNSNAMTTHQNEDVNENDSLFQIQDIGLTAFQMRTKDKAAGENISETNYLSYDPTNMKYALNTEADELSVAEGIVGGSTVSTHDTKWLLEPVGAAAKNAANAEYQHPLKVKLVHMGSQDYFTSVCFPFDVTLPRGAYAYSCQAGVMTKGDEQTIGGQKYHQLNIVQIAGRDMATETAKAEVEVYSESQVIPAGVPALLYVDGTENDADKQADGIDGGTGNTVVVPLTIGGTYSYYNKEGGNRVDATKSIVHSMRTGPLKYKYLTGELEDSEITDDELVFVFGKYSGKLGFMRNANLDYTGTKNNRFLLHNRIFYFYDPTPEGQSANFVTISMGGLQMPDPEILGIQEVETPAETQHRQVEGIYDLQGRRLPRITQPGIYIINGRKVAVNRVSDNGFNQKGE